MAEPPNRGAPGFWKTGKWMVEGAAGGFMLILSAEAEDAHLNIEGSEVLAGAVAGAAIGAVSYPMYKYFKAGYGQTIRVYPVGGRGYRIEIKR